MIGTCEVCKRIAELEEHHCIGGPGRRKITDKYPELKFMLCGTGCHRGTNGVHGKNGADLALKLKQVGQHRFVAKYGMDEWMKLYGRNYL